MWLDGEQIVLAQRLIGYIVFSFVFRWFHWPKHSSCAWLLRATKRCIRLPTRVISKFTPLRASIPVLGTLSTQVIKRKSWPQKVTWHTGRMKNTSLIPKFVHPLMSLISICPISLILFITLTLVFVWALNFNLENWRELEPLFTKSLKFVGFLRYLGVLLRYWELWDADGLFFPHCFTLNPSPKTIKK